MVMAWTGIFTATLETLLGVFSMSGGGEGSEGELKRKYSLGENNI